MKRTAPLLLLAIAACAPATRGDMGGPPLRPRADPSAVIAAEIGFNQLAQAKGQWTAFRQTAAKGAEMFVPERVVAADWLKGRADPPIAVRWQPHAVWSSCDGSHAATRGTWERAGSAGTFVTVWQRQKDGKYKWLLDMSLADERPLPPPEMVAARVADCGRSPAQREALLIDTVARDAASKAMAASDRRDRAFGGADDGTLTWTSQVSANGARSIELTLWNGAKFEAVGNTVSAAPNR